MTSNAGMLKNLRPYLGTDFVLIGDGTSLPIKVVGSSCIKINSAVLPLHNVLHVPHLANNLLSVGQLTDSYPLNCEFSIVDFCVKEWETGDKVMRGKRKGDLYILSTPQELH